MGNKCTTANFVYEAPTELKAIANAVIKGDTYTVKHWVEADETNITSTSKTGLTLLHLACKYERVEIAKLFLARDIDVNLKDFKHGHIALHVAAKVGSVALVGKLFEHGSLINTQSHSGLTPLMAACHAGQLKCVRYLLDQGAEVNLTSNDQSTALIIAADEGHDDVVECLLNQNANVNLATKDGISPLYAASQRGYESIVNILVAKGAEVHHQSKSGITPFMIGSKRGNLSVVKILHQSGASINDVDNDGENSLHVAADAGHLDIVNYLVENEVQICRNKAHKTALGMAKEGGFIDILRVLENYWQSKGQPLTDDDEIKPNNDKHKEMLLSMFSFAECLEQELYTIKYHSKNHRVASLNFDDFEALEENLHSVHNRIMADLEDTHNKPAPDLKTIQMEEKDIAKQIEKVANNPDVEIPIIKDFSDKHLLQVALKLGPDWERLASYLEVSLDDIQHLDAKFGKESIYAAWIVLVTWRKNSVFTNAERSEHLQQAATSINRNDLLALI